MKRVAPTKFAIKPMRLPKLQGGGGFLDFMGSSQGASAGEGAGMGLDVLSGLQKQPSLLSGEYGMAQDAANKYNSTVQKSQRTKQTLSKFGDAGLKSGNPYAMIGGAVLKAASFIPWGKGKQERAMNDFKTMETTGQQADNARAGALAYNSNNTGYKAPAYGRKGMKFKTKYSRI